MPDVIPEPPTREEVKVPVAEDAAATLLFESIRDRAGSHRPICAT